MAASASTQGELTLSQTFVSALHLKYNADDEPLSIVVYVPRSAPGKKADGDLVVPEHLALNFSRIAEAGPVADVAAVIAGVSELDLAENLLSQWSEVLKIISHVPRIQFLNLSNNPLHLSECFDWSSCSFAGMRQLVLNATRVSWNTVRHLLSAMPELKELHLSLNSDMEPASVDRQTFPSVTDLYVNANNMSRWEDVESLGTCFTSLTNLVMMENPLTELTGEKPETQFASLKSINLGKTLISSWTELEKLRRFPCLTDIKLQGIPFLENYEEKLRRFLIIGYLSNVERLNGSPVSVTEREDAERAFIRHYMNTAEVQSLSRYDELVGIHGELEPLVDIDMAPPSSVTVRVHYGKKSVLRNFSVHATALDVKKVLSRELVSQPHQAFHLYHYDMGSHDGQSIMKYLQRSLLNYRVRDGDEFYVELKQ